MGYPNTFKSNEPHPEASFPELFDPALKQYPSAFRHGEPTFRDPAARSRWLAARQRVLEHVLRALAQSPWKENLVLRGSTLMKQWFGPAARDPGDVDWVVRPASIGLQTPWTDDLFVGLTRMTKEGSIAENAAVHIEDVRIDDIWTYERAPGRRIVYYWRNAETAPGSLQMDFVFGEELWTPPIPVTIATPVGPALTFWAASPEQSLAWKLLWLDSDMYPQGKDLYDAVLLAERTRISAALVQRAFSTWPRGAGASRNLAEVPLSWEVDWDSFQREYPGVQGDALSWKQRLTSCLRAAVSAAGEERHA